MLSLRAAALTDIGRVRRENEDRFLLDEKTALYGVADGVGGLPGGGEAAQTAVADIANGLRGLAPTDDPDLVRIVHQTNQAVLTLGQRLSPNMGIGTTLIFGCIRGGEMRIAHVGDSRCYATHNGSFARLSEDHSVENEARIRRARGDVVYYHEANRNALTRCIGQPTPPEVDIIVRKLAAGDRFVFCTDGVTRMIPDSELGTLIAKHDTPQALVDDLVSLSVRRGGPDNATCVACFVDAT
jgi:serine/threonine protein phosphatase PrpC